MVKEECARYKAKVDHTYNDDYQSCSLISKESTAAKNEILRKVKYAKMKSGELYEFIRKKKCEITVDRELKHGIKEIVDLRRTTDGRTLESCLSDDE